MDFVKENNNIVITAPDRFDLGLTLDCGQCFRFSEIGGVWQGVVGKKLIKARQTGENIVFFDTAEDEFKNIIVPFFDFETDYGYLKKQYASDKTMAEAVKRCGGIRILRQNPWEALCSFIISQNNNITRIKGIVDRLCRSFGEKLPCGEYAFPTPQSLVGKDLSFLRAGFRDKYIHDAAEKVASGEIDLEKIADMSYESAEEELMKIKGVGLKVANCTLLYGFYRTEAFPVDVWIKRALEKFYGGVFPPKFFCTRGIAQQFLFHYIRTENISID